MTASWEADEPDGSGRRVVVRGDIDLDVAETFHDDLAQRLTLGPVDVDLGAVNFMDSAGLRSLMRLHLAHGPSMRVGPVSESVARLFDVTGVAALLGVDRGPSDIGGGSGGNGGARDD